MGIPWEYPKDTYEDWDKQMLEWLVSNYETEKEVQNKLCLSKISTSSKDQLITVLIIVGRIKNIHIDKLIQYKILFNLIPPPLQLIFV